jgi:hypothetical protein
MTTTADIVQRLQNSGFTQEQALAILSATEERFVTRDYLDSRLAALKTELVMWGVGLAFGIAAIVSGFGIAILNRLAALS